MPRPQFILILLLCPLLAYAQPDSVVQLKGVEVQVQRFSLSEELLPVQQLDTSPVALLTASSLSDKLTRESGVFVKSYGSSGIATLSMRGLGAAHTLLLWNGMPVNSPMLGLYDLALVPVFLSGRVRIQQGGGGPLAGSGAVSGVIFIDDDIPHETGTRAELLAGAGSFGSRQLGAGIRIGNGRWTSATRIYQQSANNDFNYTTPEGVRKQQRHATFRQAGFSQQIGYRNRHQRLELNLFGLKNDREIPPQLLSEVCLQEQEDMTARGNLLYSTVFRTLYLKVNAGLNHERIRYRDPMIRLDDASRSTTLRGAVEALLPAGRHFRVQLLAEWLHARAVTTGYAMPQAQDQQSAALKVLYRTTGLHVDAAVRMGLFDGKGIPVLPTLQFRIPLPADIYLRGDFSRVYRVPTLNDRFWSPGGNESLVPEEGISAGTGAGWELRKKKTTLSISAGIFYSRLNRAIVWLPGTDAIYRAVNMHSMLLYGGEATGTFSYASGNWRAGFTFTPVYTISKISDNHPQTGETGGQMIYTPKLLYRLQGDLRYKAWGLSWYQQYTGYRYTTIDHTHYLDPFSLAEIILSCDSHIRKSRTTFTISVKNLFDENYQAVAWRPMPGRSVQAGLLVEIGGIGVQRK